VQLAQFNIARMRYPLLDPRMEGFSSRLDELNALADRSPGFVWRLEDDDGVATSFRPYDDLTLINLSVWESVEDLKAFTYRTAHREPYRRRREWFEPTDQPHLVMWWVDDGTRPTVEDGMERLAHLVGHGPTGEAFTFGTVPKR
jgi:heme-degrading monooxygenase HmoA